VHLADLIIIGLYLAGMLGVGAYFLRRQERTDEYFVGDRKMGAGHIGLSVVATDVGGGFSIGLGGLGYSMGLSGSWLLFTGLIGAWLAAVVLIPRVKELADRCGWLTYPDYLENRFDGRTRLCAAVVSAVGYAGFVGGQILAGAKLSSAAFNIDLQLAVWLMAGVVVVYTALGGLQAVVYTDTIQWIVLLGGLLLLALPFAWSAVGGWEAVRAAVPAAHLSLVNISAVELLTWLLTIVPIWFVGMTLYQRIYATRDVQTARRAWFFAGLLEYPVMAFTGTLLGLLSRVMFPGLESEMGLPSLIREVLPPGVAGLVVAAYFSAIMSTADSCLLASVGNVVGDIYIRYINTRAPESRALMLSRTLTLGIGLASVSVALLLPKVLDAVLLTYAFMVSGLFVPTLAGLLWRRTSSPAALLAMLVGGGIAVLLTAVPRLNPAPDPVLVALPVSLLVLVVISLLRPSPAVSR
jgi:SSS family solute:Na+ symporter